MTKIEKMIHIDAPIEAVFAYAATIPTLPEWWTNLTNVRNFDREHAVAGLKYDWSYKMLGVHLEGHTEIVEVSENRRIVSRATGGIPNTIELTFWDAGGDRTRLDFKIEYHIPGSILGKIADKLIVERLNEHEAEHTLAHLKAICEAHAKAAAVMAKSEQHAHA